MLLTMSESSTPSKSIKPLIISGPAAHAHGLPEGAKISGHKLVVKGIYFAFDAKGEKVKRTYSESFERPPAAHLVHGQGALASLLSDKILAARLLAKDPEFRTIQTHEVVSHENALIDAPETAEQEADAAQDQAAQ